MRWSEAEGNGWLSIQQSTQTGALGIEPRDLSGGLRGGRSGHTFRGGICGHASFPTKSLWSENDLTIHMLERRRRRDKAIEETKDSIKFETNSNVLKAVSRAPAKTKTEANSTIILEVRSRLNATNVAPSCLSHSSAKVRTVDKLRKLMQRLRLAKKSESFR